MNAKICVYEGDGKFSHKLHKVCVSALYLNMVDANRWHEVYLTVAYIEDIHYFFLVGVYCAAG